MTSDRRPLALYLHPAKQRVGFPFANARLDYLTPFTLLPVGTIGLMNLLRREGISVRGLNYPAECFIHPRFALSEWLRNVDPPRLVLIDLHWYEHSFGALDVARVCKQAFPDTPVVLGGLTASFYARQILEGFPQVDFIIRGDAEEPLRQLAARFCLGEARARNLKSIPNLSYRVGDQVIENELSYHTSVDELDNLDFVNLDFLDHARQYLAFQYVGRRGLFMPDKESQLLGHWLSIGRGCSFNCSFCGGSRSSHDILAGRKGLVMRSVDAVVDDIEALQKRGVHQVALSLDPAIVGKAYWRKLFSGLSRRRIRIGIYNEAFQLPSVGFVQAFAECADLDHSQLALSVLSGDERVRKENGKYFSNRDLLGVLRRSKRCQVPVAIYYSFNLPGQDESSLRKTLSLSEQIGDLYPSDLLMMYNQPHTLDPCSPMSGNPENFDIEIYFRSFEDYYNYCRNTAMEKPGVLGLEHRGFRRRGLTREVEGKMQRLWLDFARRQPFLCF